MTRAGGVGSCTVEELPPEREKALVSLGPGVVGVPKVREGEGGILEWPQGRPEASKRSR